MRPFRFLLALVLLSPSNLVAQSSAEFDSVVARYGRIRTVAGSGARDDCNDWRPAHEGAAGTLADLSRPHSAAADAEGNIYIADKEGFAVRKLDFKGKIHTVAGTGTFGDSTEPGPATETDLWGPNGIFVFPDGTFYCLTVNDDCQSVQAGGKIHRVTPGGSLTTVFEDPNVFVGRGLYVMPDHRTIYYCAGNVFKRWTESGGITTVATGFSSLGNIDREASGSFLVTDRSGNRVWRVQEDGSKEVVAGNGATSGGGHGQLATSTGLNQVRGVAVLDTGGYFLCTHRAHQVWYVDSSGFIWNFINPSGTNGHAGDLAIATHPTVQISEPRNITIAPNGDLLLTEHDNGYVRQVTNISVPPRIVDLYFEGAGFVVKWRGHRDADYLVRTSPDLENWTIATPVPLNIDMDGFGSFLDRNADPRVPNYYQVIALEP